MKIHHLIVPLLCAIVPSLHGCSSEDLVSPIEEATQPTFTLTLQVKGNGGVLSRDPSLSTETPLRNEQLISNCLLILYPKSLNSTDLTDADKVSYVLPFTFTAPDASVTDIGNQQSATVPLPPALVGGDYYAFVVANTTMTTTDFTGKKLTELRDMTYNQDSWTAASPDYLTKYHTFVMTSDQEWLLHFKDTDKQDAVITMERLASRLDVSLSNNGNGTDFVFKVYDENAYTNENKLEETGNTFTLSSIQVLNLSDRNEYLIQRSADNYTGTPTYFGDEAISSNICSKLVQSPSAPATYKSSLARGKGHLSNNNHTVYVGSESERYCILTYMRETTNDASKPLTLRLNGSFHDSSKGTDTNVYYDFPIRHCNTSSGALYDIVRNTIYRIKFDKLFADGQHVYVRWYYYNTADMVEDNNNVVVTSFNRYIKDGDGTNAD